MPEQIQDVLLAVASMACGGLHILLRLLSLHLSNEDMGDTLTLYFRLSSSLRL